MRFFVDIYGGIIFTPLHIENSIPVFQVQPSCGTAACETAPRPANSQSDQRDSQTLTWQSGSQRHYMKIMILLLRPSTDLRGRPCYTRLSRGTTIQWGYDDTVAGDSLIHALVGDRNNTAKESRIVKTQLIFSCDIYHVEIGMKDFARKEGYYDHCKIAQKVLFSYH